jgi:hypothetical protein
MTLRLRPGILSVALWLAGNASADEHPAQKLIRIENGENRIDLLGDGTPSLVVSGHRENFNAHSAEVVSFYVQADVGGKKQWLIVPIANTNSKQWDEKFELIVNGGADCRLNDFRLLARNGERPTTLIVAKRSEGDFVERKQITFSYYTLIHNTEGSPGDVPYLFDLARVTTSKSDYCDVDEAMKTELGIGKP